MAISLYAAGTLLGKSLLPTVFGVAIHPFAWMIVVVTILAMLGWVPQETKAAAKRLQSFMSSCLVLTIMVGVGADTDLNQLMAAITLSNVVISFLIVVGAILGSAIVGQWVGFYPIDSAITAGLCMANPRRIRRPCRIGGLPPDGTDCLFPAFFPSWRRDCPHLGIRPVWLHDWKITGFVEP